MSIIKFVPIVVVLLMTTLVSGSVSRETEEGSFNFLDYYVHFTCFNRPYERFLPREHVCREKKRPSVEELIPCSIELLHAICMDVEEAADILRRLTLRERESSLPKMVDLGVTKSRHLPSPWAIKFDLFRRFTPETVEEILEMSEFSRLYLEVHPLRELPLSGDEYHNPKFFVRISYLLTHPNDLESEMDKPIVYRQEDPRYGKVMAFRDHNLVVTHEKKM